MLKKYYSLSLLAVVLLMVSCDSGRNTDATMSLSGEQQEIETERKLLRHIVMFGFNDKASVEIVNNIENAFAALPDSIPEIHSFEWGINNSPEGLNNGLTHSFLVTFLSEEDRATYLPHPAHQSFVKFIGPYVESVTVLDYWTD